MSRKTGTTDRIRVLLRDNGPMTVADLAEALGDMPRDNVAALVGERRRAGEFSGTVVGGKPTYALVPNYVQPRTKKSPWYVADKTATTKPESITPPARKEHRAPPSAHGPTGPAPEAPSSAPSLPPPGAATRSPPARAALRDDGADLVGVWRKKSIAIDAGIELVGVVRELTDVAIALAPHVIDGDGLQRLMRLVASANATAALYARSQP